jgi:allophanate hydrolase subunit 2
MRTFLSEAYTVSHRADRMGMQLDGPALAHAGGFNIVSDGVANGSIQVPGHGRPVILLADRQTTGGYPKIATVIEPDLGLLAQARPGAHLRFSALAPDEAEAAARAFRKETAALLARVSEAPAHGHLLASERLLGLNLVDGVVGPAQED